MADAINAQTYAMLRTYIEAGSTRYQRWKETGVWPEGGEPSTNKLLGLVLKYVTPDLIPLDAAESAQLKAAGGKQLPPALRRGDVVFRDRDQLIAAVDELAPDLAKQVAQVPGSDSGGVEWWAVALSAAGTLAWIGKLSWQGALVSIIASRILLGVVAYLGLTAKTDEGKNIVAEAAKAAANKAGDVANSIIDAGTIVLYGVAGAVVVGVVIFAVNAGRRGRW